MEPLSPIYFIFQAMLASLVLVLGLAWISIRVANRVGLIDIPGKEPHKRHLRPTPIAGGLALVAALLISVVWLGAWKEPSVRAGLIASIPVFIAGLWDDARGLPPPVKLGAQFLAAALLFQQGVYVRMFESPQFLLFTNPTLALVLDILITLLWVVGITNAFNFVDSMDGLVVGLAGLAGAFFVLLTLDAGQNLLSQHSAVIVGICLGLYLYNSPPALLFLGDSGAQTLGFLLAVLSIGYVPQVVYQASSWFVPILLLGIPIFDATLIVFSRLRRGRPVYSAGMDHTYHRLQGLVGSTNRAVLVMHVSAFALGCLGFLALQQPPVIANALFGLTLLLGGASLIFLERCDVSL